MAVICPKCGHDDLVLAVPGIVQQYTARYYGSARTTGTVYSPGGPFLGKEVGENRSYTVIDGGTATELARRLQFPAAPQPDIGCLQWVLMTTLGMWGGAVVGVMGGLAAAAVLTIGLALLTGEIGSGAEQLLVWGAFLGFVAGTLGGPVVWYFMAKRRAEARNRPAVAAWRARQARWAQLYYCQRDHIVFDPRTNAYCLPEEWSTLV